MAAVGKFMSAAYHGNFRALWVSLRWYCTRICRK